MDLAAALDAACTLILREAEAALKREAHTMVQVGRLHDRLNEPDHARNAYRAALRSEPTHPIAHARLADIAVAAGDRQAALAHLAVLQRAHPEHPQTKRLTRVLGEKGAKAAE
jgi:predicted Zn-dependent protease